MSRPSPSWISLRRPAGVLFWASVLLLFAGFVVPLIHANRFRGRIQVALENALGRKVEIGDVTLSLLTGPGFQMSNVIIGEDPTFGAEHFAYMTSMQARLRLRTLWTGQVQLASLTLVEPSINLVKNAQGRWNFETLMDRAGGGPSSGVAASAYFPYVGIDSGRLNFKFGDWKSVFHVQAVEAAISPPRDAGGRWWIRLGGTPARTDQILSGMGRITAEGALTPSSHGAHRVHFDLALGTSPLSQLVALTHGRSLGVHGELGATARLSGGISDIRVQGTLQVGDVHRWDLLPAEQSRYSIPFRGTWSLPRQDLLLETDPDALPAAVRVTFGLQNYLSAPQWKGTIEMDQAPAAPLVRIAQHFGAAVPAGTELRGALGGALEFSGSPWPHGVLRLAEGRLLLPDLPPVAIGPAQLRLAGPAFELTPAEVRVPGDEEAVLEVSASGRLDEFRIATVIAARDASLETLRGHAALLNPVWLASISAGRWDGRVAYRKQPGEPAAWTGSGTLTKALWQPEGLESPVEIAEARLRWEPRLLQLEPLAGALGETRFTGTCRRRSSADAPSEAESSCQLRVEELALDEFDRWVNQPRKRSLWEVWKRALNTRQAPAWLTSASVRGGLAVENLRVGQWVFRNVRSQMTFSGGNLVLSRLRAELAGASVSGALKAEFAGALPRYSLQATARGVDLKSLSASAALPLNVRRGTVDLKLGLSAAGRTAADLRAALKVNGVFDARSVLLEDIEWKDPEGEPENTLEIRSLEGQFAWTRQGVELTKMQLAVGKDHYAGRGSIGGRPQFLLEGATEGRPWRLVSARREELAPAAP